LKIAVQGQAADVEVVRELLSPWNVSFTSLDEADVVIAYKEKPLETKKTIVVPSDSADFMRWIKDAKLRVVSKPGDPVFVAASSQTVLSVKPKMLYYYEGLIKSAPRDNFPTATEINEDLIFLTLDIVKEYNEILDETLNAKPSTAYRLLTGLPFSYTLVPKKLKDFLIRRRGGKENLTFYDKLPLDALRFILLKAIEELLDKKFHKKAWNGKGYACAMTHDIDTCNGLRKAKCVKKLEEKYDVPSAWYIPSKHFRLNYEIVEELANYGEIGSHDTRHDGKLVQLPEQELVKRLREAKQTLENIINCSVNGFRAPLLQHSPSILHGLKEAGYTYDTSIPTWEPRHPRTMRPHGLGTMYPMFFDGLAEIQISVVQDHQLLYVLGLKPKEVIAEWLSIMTVIKELGGCCVFLSHPEYKLFDVNSLAVYEELLNSIVSDEQVWLATPKQIVSEAGK
jgi:peptidoglycan/xylan/chitin deacetylase (PgdA/CDA1 family)